MGTHLHQESINSNGNNTIAMKSMRPHQRGGTSESSTTSDNTTDFIDIVKKHDVVYNTHHPDYKNVEVKLKVWTQIAKEIGLSVDASKRKWKNLRDSYTKYLRSFRAGSKTSRKYQFWAHADHMEFLKPFQGPGRSNNGIIITKDEDETECDLGYHVLAKATANSTDEDVMKTSTVVSNATSLSLATSLTNVLPNFAAASGLSTSTMALSMTTGSTGLSTAGALVLPVPSLPTVQLPPSLTAKPIMGSITTNPISSTATSLSASMSLSTPSSLPSSLASLTSSSVPSQVFTLPTLSTKGPIPMPASNTASSVGCLIIEPQLFASADTFKKEFTNTSMSSLCSSSSTCTTQITPSNLHIYPNISAQVTPASAANAVNRLNPPVFTKIRRVQPSPQQQQQQQQQQQASSAINLSFSSPSASSLPLTSSTSSLAYNMTNGFSSTAAFNNFLPNFSSTIPSTITATTSNGPYPAKRLKSADSEISAILQANRELDANTLFFLSLARSVRSMPTKFQSLAKMRCMRIVSDIELELDNLNSDITEQNGSNNTKYCTTNTDSPPPAVGHMVAGHTNDPQLQQSEHFVYVMSPSRVENMIDLSSDDENTQNGPVASGPSVVVGTSGSSGGICANATNNLIGATN